MTQTHDNEDHVVVTGVALVTSLGVTAAETYSALSAGQTGIRPIPDIDAEGSVFRMGAQAQPIEPSDVGIRPKDARMIRLQGIMLMKAAKDAFLSASLSPPVTVGDSIGLFVGMGYMDYEVEELFPAIRVCLNRDGSFNDGAFFSSGYQQIHPLWPLSILNNIAVCQIGIALGIKGENAVFAPYGDAGAQAVAEGMRAIRDERAAIALTGGVSDKISPLSLARNASTAFLTADPPPMQQDVSSRGEEGRTAFLGEGCAVMVLESASGAKNRGAPLLAQVSGFGSAVERESDRPWPTSEAVHRAMAAAVADAGIDSCDIDLVIAHGDGTLGDRNESDAIQGVSPDGVRPIDGYASKGALGDLLAASPVADAVLSICMMRQGVIPPTLPLGFSEYPRSLNLMCGKAREKSPKHVLINTRGHQGQCASLILSACR